MLNVFRSDDRSIADADWVEIFSKKLGAALINNVVQKFKARYPSEDVMRASNCSR